MKIPQPEYLPGLSRKCLSILKIFRAYHKTSLETNNDNPKAYIFIKIRINI